MTVKPESLLTAAEANISRLQSVIAGALEAMNNGRYGDARRILTKGTDEPLKPTTTVLTKVSG